MNKYCAKCGGMMVAEKNYHPFDLPWWGMKCPFCGTVTDPVILENKREQEANLQVNCE